MNTSGLVTLTGGYRAHAHSVVLARTVLDNPMSQRARSISRSGATKGAPRMHGHAEKELRSVIILPRKGEKNTSRRTMHSFRRELEVRTFLDYFLNFRLGNISLQPSGAMLVIWAKGLPSSPASKRERYGHLSTALGYTAANAHDPAKYPFCHACVRLPFFWGAW